MHHKQKGDVLITVSEVLMASDNGEFEFTQQIKNQSHIIISY